MRVQIIVQRGDEEVHIDLSPDSYDQTGDDHILSTVPSPADLIDIAAIKAKAALAATIGSSHG